MTSRTTDFTPIPEDRSDAERFQLWFSLFAGMVAWAAQLWVSWAMVPAVCSGASTTRLQVVTIVSALVALAGLVVGIRLRRDSDRRPADMRAATARETNQFMATLGVASSAIFLLLILMSAVGPFVLVPCGAS